MQIDNVAFVFDDLTTERNAIRDEVSELKRNLAEVEGERDALRELNALLYRALENIANNGATNADLAKRTLALYEDRAK